jgi:hypothetical protein
VVRERTGSEVEEEEAVGGRNRERPAEGGVMNDTEDGGALGAVETDRFEEDSEHNTGT